MSPTLPVSFPFYSFVLESHTLPAANETQPYPSRLSDTEPDKDFTMSYEKDHNKTSVDPTLYANEPVDEEVGVTKRGDALKKDLRSRHMQMIAIGTRLPRLYGHSRSLCF